jgi:hypothetical protein
VRGWPVGMELKEEGEVGTEVMKRAITYIHLNKSQFLRQAL